MKYSAIILSGGESKRFGKDKGLFMVFEKPLISYIIEKVELLVDEVIIITSDQVQAEKYFSLFPEKTILVDEYQKRGTIIGAVTGFRYASGFHSFLIPCDTPLISVNVLSLLKQLSEDYHAVIPRWPTGYIEPLQAIYKTQDAYKASKTSIKEGKFSLRNMISKLPNILYVSTMTLKKIDPSLSTFYNINTFEDLERIKKFLK